MPGVLERYAQGIRNRVTSQFVQKHDIGGVYGGVQVEGAQTVEDALEMSGLNWETELVPVQTPYETVNNVYATIRSDTHQTLGVVRTKYTPIHNRRAFHFVNKLIKGGANVTSAGALYNGRIVFINVDLGGLDVLGEDPVNRHLLIVNSHDTTLNLVLKLLPYRLSCQNQLDAILADKAMDMMKIRHTSGSSQALVNAAKVLQVADSHFKEVESWFQAFTRVECSAKQIEQLIIDTMEIKPEAVAKWKADGYDKQPKWVAQYNKVVEFITIGPGSDVLPRSLWNVYNGLNGYYDHVRTVRNGNDPEFGNDIKWESRFNGTSARGKVRAYKMCKDLAKAVKAFVGRQS